VADNVTATLPSPLPAGFWYKNLKFITTNQTEISYTVPGASNTIELSLPGGSDGTEYSLHAVYNTTSGWKQIGRVDVMSRSLKTFNVVIVPVDPAVGTVETAKVQDGLNGIYSQYGIKWTVEVDTAFANQNSGEIYRNIKDYQLIAGDKFLSEYSSQQIALHNLYKQQDGYDDKKPVVFLFTKPPKKADNSIVKGEMPIGRRWCYLYEGVTVNAHTLAHELGHGRFRLLHTFDDNSCGISEKGNTNNNLMDNPVGDTLVCKQWEYVHNNALIGKIFQDDEDAAVQEPNMLTFDIISLLNTIRKANMDKKGTSEITDFSLSNRNAVDFIIPSALLNLITDDFELAFVDIKTGGKIIPPPTGTSTGVQFEPLYIKPSEIVVTSDIDIAKAKGLTGYFTKFTFYQYLKSGDTYTKSTKNAIEIVVRGRQTQTFKAFLKGEPIPEIDYPCEKCGRDLTVSYERLDLIFPKNSFVTPLNVVNFNDALKRGGFNTCKQHAHFFSKYTLSLPILLILKKITSIVY
jgi:hypothetical protein